MGSVQTTLIFGKINVRITYINDVLFIFFFLWGNVRSSVAFPHHLYIFFCFVEGISDPFLNELFSIQFLLKIKLSQTAL